VAARGGARCERATAKLDRGMAGRGTGAGRHSQQPGSPSQPPTPLTGERPCRARSTCQWPPQLRQRVPGTARRGDRNREVEDGGPPAAREIAPSTQISSTLTRLFITGISIGRYFSLFHNSVRIYILSPAFAAGERCLLIITSTTRNRHTSGMYKNKDDYEVA
jgi:hypothetical protein